MTGEKPVAAASRGTAPVLHSQEDIRHLVGKALAHLANGSALIKRCGKSRLRPGDAGMCRLSARVISADAVLGKRLAKLLLPPKAKSKRDQRLAEELNSHSFVFSTRRPR